MSGLVRIGVASLEESAGICSTLFVQYCICFNYKRQSGPSFKNKENQKLARERGDLSKSADLRDAGAVQRFFLEETHLSEEFLVHGGDEKGVGLLANVTAVRAQPWQLLLGLQQALPAPQFQMLLTKLSVSSQRTVSAQSLT
ncbi:mitochondrial import receptor subunit TOM20 homolog [Arvicola amphibius]|uniref:mitochondrial import receptor subunit TOM20 homolog n=1 Tax=Arvicola amphibius TaxID=1047088 RepID=UPI001C089562|nr:mitochondrial import receptor subunit TOM20 homolog [Arvicola amphibius]